MKALRTLVILQIAFLFWTASMSSLSADFVLLDDFESYPAGSIAGKGDWTFIGGNVDVVQNPGGDALVPAGSVLSFHDANNSRASMELPETIAVGTTGTIFFRARFHSDSNNQFSMMTAQNVHPVSTGGAAGEVATQLFAHSDANLRVFSGNSHNPLTPYDIEQWYNIWFVIDNAARTTKIYIQGGEFEAQTQLAWPDNTREFGYRRPLPAPADILAFWGHTFDTGNYFLDHIWLDATGENLVNPVSQPTTPMLITGLAPALDMPWHFAGHGLGFTVTTVPENTLLKEDIELYLNDAPVSFAELAITGESPSFTVSYDGLAFDTEYTAKVVATDSEGQVERWWTFRTLPENGIVEDTSLRESSNDVLQGIVPHGSHPALEGTLSRLTDAPSAKGTTERRVIPGPDNTVVELTWDLGGTAYEIETRRLDRIDVWLDGEDAWRTGFDGEFAISSDGVNFISIPGSRVTTALAHTGNPIDGMPLTSDGTGTDQPNLVSQQFDPTDTALPGGFRYLRLISYGYDSVDDSLLRQPRLMEVDAFTSTGPINRVPSSLPFVYDFGTVRLLNVLPQTGGQYDLETFGAGVAPFIDDPQTIVSFPVELDGKLMLRTANAEARWLAEGQSEIQWTYVDALPDFDPDWNSMVGANTTLADGSGIFQPAANAGSSPDWTWRPFGNGGAVLQATGPGERPELVTSASGFESFEKVAVSVAFWSDQATWGVRAGLSSANNENPFFDPDSPETVLGETLNWTAAPMLEEGNRLLYTAFVGNAVADWSGKIQVFIDDLPTTSVNRRTFYDGLAVGDAPRFESGAYLVFEVDRDVSLYIINDPISEAAWLTGNYTKTAMTVQTTGGSFEVWERALLAGEQVSLPGNSGGADENNFWVVLGESQEEIADSGESFLAPAPFDEWSQQAHSWRVTTDAAAALHTASLATEVSNFNPANGFILTTDLRVPRLQDAGDNAIGLLLLGDGVNSIQAEWLPRESDESSTIRLVDTLSGTVLAETAWAGLQPGRVTNNVGLVGGGEDRLGVGVSFFANDPFLLDDFEDAAASGGSWTTGGINDNWEVGVPTSGPGSARSGVNVFATDLDSNFAATTDNWLRSPVIDLTGVETAVLRFWEALETEDLDPFNGAIVSVLAADTEEPIAVLSDSFGDTGGWVRREFPLSGDMVDREIIIQFQLVTGDFVSVAGWFLDDVSVTRELDGVKITAMPAALTPDGVMPGIRTGENELDNSSDDYLQFAVEDRDLSGGVDGVTVYVAWDIRNSGLEPNWLRNSFTPTNQFVETSASAGQHRLWAREYSDGEQVTLGGASATGAGPFPRGTNNYFVLLGDVRTGLDSIYTLETEGIRTDGTWNLSMTLTDANGFSATVAAAVVASLDGRKEFGVFVRHPDVAGPLLSAAPLGEITGLAMDLLEVSGFLVFEDWQMEKFTPAQRGDLQISGPSATPAGDGIANLLKYALDPSLSPFTPITLQDLVQMDIDEQGRLILVYSERTDINDIDYIPEVSEGLNAWSTENVTELYRESVDVNLLEVGVRGEFPAEAGRGFIRLRVEGLE